MDHVGFWTVIETARQRHPDDIHSQIDEINHALTMMPPDEIIAFEEIYYQLRIKAYTEELWGAAYLMNGGCGDDSFEYFRGWLICRGRKIYETAIADPDSLADQYDPSCEYDGENLLYVADRAFRTVTGESLPTRCGYPELRGEPWQESELEQKYPGIAAKMHESGR